MCHLKGKSPMESRRIFLKKSALMGAATTLPFIPSCFTISTIAANVSFKPRKISKVAIVWYSQTGNTQKCGKVLARTFEKKGITVIDGDVRDVDRTKISDVDLLVIGAPVFYYDIPGFVKEFIQSLPDLKGIPVAAYVTFGGPEGNQHNAACSILEGLVQKKGVPVSLKAFMTISSYTLNFKASDKEINPKPKAILPDHSTYENVRAYAGLLRSAVEQGHTSTFKKRLTLREFSTYFGPEWWTKLLVDNHYIIEQNCVGCGTCIEKCPTNSIDLDTFLINTDTCVLCCGCINNCEYQAVNMEYSKEKIIGFKDFLKKNHLKFELPVELSVYPIVA
jgi:ferredoxin/flavodoxin